MYKIFVFVLVLFLNAPIITVAANAAIAVIVVVVLTVITDPTIGMV